MQETRLRVNENGRVVIPAEYRRAMGIKKGDEVILSMDKHELHITTLRQRVAKAQERMARYIKPGRLLSEELIAERREAAKHE
ncbi:AbrB/MazE/SpoVT family DNA-binding domain-containing protein [Paracidobacterium acidisoli]|uniref:AbrB/MazE/SpoVT family DNA-binding domain-containing protein n=1 Tax=Paracidobacterium acidisoli TaxID=2303751 RepID=A0A372IPH4_9BACT|nr:AbrB/MazE/SpoVT family DNA-binding domain-containing protein [Paracidobacterium acidisoli]MBT9331091.1 AbrB/MazE/SpoVT family DNA-binding domain-containing protein [Paracidobacterium acidisoli]